MPRLSMVYDGYHEENLTKDDLISAILNEYKCNRHDEKIRKAMSEAFRCGFLRGEDFGRGS